MAAANQMLWLTFAPVTIDSARYYGVSEGAIGALSEIFPLLFVLLAVPAGLLLDRWLRPVLLAGAALTTAGGLLRLAGDSYSWLLAGQILVAVAAVSVVVLGFFLLSALPVILDLADRNAGKAGASAATLIWLAGNAGGIAIALLVQLLSGRPSAAFAAAALVIASVIPLMSKSDSTLRSSGRLRKRPASWLVSFASRCPWGGRVERSFRNPRAAGGRRPARGRRR